MAEKVKFTGGTSLAAQGGNEVSATTLQSGSNGTNFVATLVLALQKLRFVFSATSQGLGPAASNTANCDSLPARGQKIGERGGGLARRRYQTGRVFLRGKKGREVWVGRWREDE